MSIPYHHAGESDAAADQTQIIELSGGKYTTTSVSPSDRFALNESTVYIGANNQTPRRSTAAEVKARIEEGKDLRGIVRSSRRDSDENDMIGLKTQQREQQEQQEQQEQPLEGEGMERVDLSSRRSLSAFQLQFSSSLSTSNKSPSSSHSLAVRAHKNSMRRLSLSAVAPAPAPAPAAAPITQIPAQIPVQNEQENTTAGDENTRNMYSSFRFGRISTKESLYFGKGSYDVDPQFNRKVQNSAKRDTSTHNNSGEVSASSALHRQSRSGGAVFWTNNRNPMNISSRFSSKSVRLRRKAAEEREKTRAAVFKNMINSPRPVDVVNGDREGLFSRLIYGAMHANLYILALVPFLVLVVAALLFSVVTFALECHHLAEESSNPSILEYMLYSLSDLIGNHYMSAPASQHAECVMLISLAGYVGLVFQSVLFGLVVHRIMQPPANQLVFSDKCLLHSRDGKKILSFRVCQKFGRAVHNVQYSAIWVEKCTSFEGEQFARIHPLKVQGNSLLVVPMTVTHKIDETSPLFNKDPAHKAGSIYVFAEGTDSSLDWSVDAVGWYYPTDILTELKYWPSILHAPSMSADSARKASTKTLNPAFDFEKFNLG